MWRVVFRASSECSGSRGDRFDIWCVHSDISGERSDCGFTFETHRHCWWSFVRSDALFMASVDMRILQETKLFDLPYYVPDTKIFYIMSRSKSILQKSICLRTAFVSERVRLDRALCVRVCVCDWVSVARSKGKLNEL